MIEGTQIEMFERGASWDSDSISMDEFGKLLSKSGGSAVYQAMKVSAFMACADVIAQDISKATFRLRELLENNTSKIVSPLKNPIAEMLAVEPNPRHTWTNFFEMMTYWLSFKDNAYCVIKRNLKGEIVALIPVQSTAVNERIIYDPATKQGEVIYQVTASTQHEQQLLGDVSLMVPERDMLHFRKRLIDGMSGYGTLNIGQDAIDAMRAIDDFRKNLFAEDGMLRGVFTLSKDAEPLSEPNFNRLRSQFRELMSRFRRLNAPIVLEGGMDFKEISSNPTEMELSKQLEAQVQQMCRLFRVPPHKVFLMDGSKYSNMEAQDRAYVSDVLIPIAKIFEGEFSKKILQSRRDRVRYFFQLDRDEMVVRDQSVELERVTKAAERSILTIDEARASLGKNELPNGAGKVRLIPTNMTMVDEHNEPIIAGASTPQPSDPGAAPPANDSPDDKNKLAPPLRLVT